MKNSFSYRVTTAGVEIGTNVVYARRHHFGYEGGTGRGRAATPARPFLLFQDEDLKEVGEIFTRHIEKK
jgi:phage gpG-like protein